jgi:hypothetical protein
MLVFFPRHVPGIAPVVGVSVVMPRAVMGQLLVLVGCKEVYLWFEVEFPAHCLEDVGVQLVVFGVLNSAEFVYCVVELPSDVFGLHVNSVGL